MAERHGGDPSSSSSANASGTADRRRPVTSSKRGHQHHPKFMGSRQPPSAVEVISALRAATSSGGGTLSGELPRLLDRLNNNNNNNKSYSGTTVSPSLKDPERATDNKSAASVGADCSSAAAATAAPANAQVEHKNVSNLLIELPSTSDGGGVEEATTTKTRAEESCADAQTSGQHASKAIRSANADEHDPSTSRRTESALQQRLRRHSAQHKQLKDTPCDTPAAIDQRSSQRLSLVSQDSDPGAFGASTADDVGEGDEEEDSSAAMAVTHNVEEDEDEDNNNSTDQRRRKKSSTKSSSVLTERNSNKPAGAKRRSTASAQADTEEAGAMVEPKRKNPSSKKEKREGKERKKTSSKSKRTGDVPMDQSMSTDMTSSQESRSEDTENDPEAAEWAKLRCTSERTEVVAEREYRRQNRRCADYPGLAFGRSVFSSDTMMKFNIIRNELHNIMKTQLKRVRGGRGEWKVVLRGIVCGP